MLPVTQRMATRPASVRRPRVVNIKAVAAPPSKHLSTLRTLSQERLMRSSIISQVATMDTPSIAAPQHGRSTLFQLPQLAVPSIKLPHNLRKRLFTHIDFIHLHAGSASLSLVQGIYEALRVGYFMAHDHTLPGPEADWVLPVLAVLTLTRDMTGLTMALQHRKGVTQRVFVSGALMSASFYLMMWYYDPSFPTAESGCEWATHLVRTALCIMAPTMALLSLGDCTVNVSEFLGARDDKAIRKENPQHGTDSHHDSTPAPTTTAASPSTDSLNVTTTAATSTTSATTTTTSASTEHIMTRASSAVGHAASLAAYYLPTALPTWVAALGAFMVVMGGDDLRQYMVEHWPHYREMNFSWTMVGLMAGAVGSFATTLRDRYLISRSTEMAVIGLPFYYFLAVVAFSFCTYEDSWDLLRVGYDPVFANHLLAVIHPQ